MSAQDGRGGWAARIDWGEGLKSESVTRSVASDTFQPHGLYLTFFSLILVIKNSLRVSVKIL